MDGTFLARPNRFVIQAELATGETILAHCADRGRLLWLKPGQQLLLGVKPEPGRRTGFQAAAAWTGEAWASLDTHLPNRLIEAALRMGALERFRGYSTLRREARHRDSRFDFRLEEGPLTCYLEVKSVGTSWGGTALFPDAPTTRGQRHLRELRALATAGIRTAVLFVAQHAGAWAVAPCCDIDPEFASELAAAAAGGVEIYAYCCPIERDGITLGREIPVLTAGAGV